MTINKSNCYRLKNPVKKQIKITFNFNINYNINYDIINCNIIINSNSIIKRLPRKSE